MNPGNISSQMEREIMFADRYFELPVATVFVNSDNNINDNVNAHIYSIFRRKTMLVQNKQSVKYPERNIS